MAVLSKLLVALGLDATDYQKGLDQVGSTTNTKLGNLGKTLGNIGQTATKWGVTLASDLASFNNAMPQEALDALRAGLTGETEPLKRFGVNLSAAGVAAKALELGLADVVVDEQKVHGLTLDLADAQEKAAEALAEHGASSSEYAQAAQKVVELKSKIVEASKGEVQELTSAQKAQAIYALIMQQTTTAQGDFIRTSDGLANSTRIAKAQLADAAATMGSQLLPYGLKVVQFVSDLITKFSNLSPETQKVILIVAGLAAAVGPLLLVFGSLMSGLGAILPVISSVGGALGSVAAVVGGPLLLVIGLIAGAIALLALAWANNWFGIRDTLTEIWETTLKPALEQIILWFQETIPIAIQFLSDVWNNVLLPAIKAVWEFIETYLIPLFTALANVVIALVKKEIEIMAALWENVLKPALSAVWEFIKNNVIPIFEAIASKLEGPIASAIQWFISHILEPLAGAWEGVKSAIAGISAMIQNVADAISNLTLPDWLIPGSPTPLELGVKGINKAVQDLATVGLPRLEHAMAGLGDYSATVVASGGHLPAGDHYEIHNESAGAAALSWAIIEDRRRRRLNATMGG